MHIIVRQSMEDQQWPFQFIGVRDRGAAFVRLWILVGKSETLGGIAWVRRIIILPIEYRTQCCRRRDPFWRAKYKHPCHKPAVTPAIHTDMFLIDGIVFDHIVNSIDMVIIIFTAEKLVHVSSPIAPIAGRSAVVDVENDITLSGEQ